MISKQECITSELQQHITSLQDANAKSVKDQSDKTKLLETCTNDIAEIRKQKVETEKDKELLTMLFEDSKLTNTNLQKRLSELEQEIAKLDNGDDKNG